MHFTNSLRFVLVCSIQRRQAIALLSVPSGGGKVSSTFTLFFQAKGKRLSWGELYEAGTGEAQI